MILQKNDPVYANEFTRIFLRNFFSTKICNCSSTLLSEGSFHLLTDSVSSGENRDNIHRSQIIHISYEKRNKATTVTKFFLSLLLTKQVPR